MSKASRLSSALERVDVEKGLGLIENAQKGALQFDVIDDAMCIMHDDGSVNIIESIGGGVMRCEVISAENILKVLQHYRPFADLFGSARH